MIWMILTLLTLLFSILCLYVAISFKRDTYFLSAGFLLIISIIVGAVTMDCVINWKSRAQEYQMLDALIQNKLEKIEMMKDSYKQITNETGQMNIDMVNRDLTLSITKQIEELEEFTYGVNREIARWHVKYKNRFWTTCFVKPPRTRPILIKDLR